MKKELKIEKKTETKKKITDKKKTQSKEVNKKSNAKKKKAFTLIELLAVIIILGILMIIAIPSVTKYISDSRKNSYIDTARQLISGAKNMVNKGELGMYNTDTTYYLPSSCVKTENGGDSPYGKFTQAYIGVTYDGKGYNYFWISVDESGHGIKGVTSEDKLDIDLIESNIKSTDIEETVNTTGIGARSEIKILNCDTNSWERQIHLDDTSNNASEEGGASSESDSQNSGIAIIAEGQTCNKTDVGCELIIEEENFYVVSSNASTTVLLTKYDLKKDGNNYIQDNSNTNSLKSEFTRMCSWDKASCGYYKERTQYTWLCLGGSYGLRDTYLNRGESYNGNPYPYVYLSSSLTTIVNSYKNKINTITEEEVTGRLMSYEEAYALKNNALSTEVIKDANNSCYWLGSSRGQQSVFIVNKDGVISSSTAYSTCGVRPILEISTSEL